MAAADAVAWSDGFPRVPDEPWTEQGIQELAAKYDTVEQHGWYHNLDPTVEEVAAYLRDLVDAADTDPDDPPVLVDYSGGTGIFLEWLLLEIGDLPVRLLNVDSSPKFLRLSLEKFRDEDRVALRRIRYLDEEERLELLDEVLDGPLLDRGVDGLVSTNAIHLYYDLPDTLASWRRVLRPGARCFVQSGNVDRDDRPADRWTIDATVDAVADAAREVVSEAGRGSRWAPYREALDDAERMAAHDEVRRKFFLPVRPLSFYVEALEDAGFEVEAVRHRPVEVRVPEWHEFLAVYHEGILGWVGGTERVEGEAPSDEAVEDRKALLRAAMERVFEGGETFTAEWTYLTCVRPG